MILLLDNYDSFVHNLARYFRRLGCETHVVRSDRIDAKGCAALHPDAIVVSPGPRRPEQAGGSVDVIRQLAADVPILGVCLGHQAIGVAFGGQVVTCGPVHGSASLVRHCGTGLFDRCLDPMPVGRYHALAIDPGSMPRALRVTASTDDGIVMAVEHRRHPVYGIQFHPESVLTEQGDEMIGNFLAAAKRFHESRRHQEAVS